MKILIVEDEDSLREIMIRSLEKGRYVVESAANYKFPYKRQRCRSLV